MSTVPLDQVSPREDDRSDAGERGAPACSTLKRVRLLVPMIMDAAPELERTQRLADGLLAGLKAAGVFRMYVSRAHGGDQVTALEGVLVLEELARADGSVGWLGAIGSDSPAFFTFLPRRTYEQVYAKGPDVIMAGSALPRGIAVSVDGGFRFTGRWPFASGCLHADYLSIAAPVRDEAGADLGRVVLGIVPTDQIDILDTWHVSGLRGTGSHDIVATDLFVPTEWTGCYFEPPEVAWHPLDRTRPLARLGIQLGAVAVGIARGAVDDLRCIARVKRPLGGLVGLLAETITFQHRFGQLDLDLRIARTLLHHEAEKLWQAALDDHELSQRELLDQRTVLARIGDLAVDVVTGCYRAAGTTGLYDGHPLQRRLRDVNAAVQHMMFSTDSLTPSGALLLGQPVQGMLV